jgi:uncharacterized protein (TIGR01777 family)
MKNIVITGATGFIGKKVTNSLIARGDKVTVFTRSVEKAEKIFPGAENLIIWNQGAESGSFSFESIDAVIHLAGENVMGRRWSEQHKKNLLASRVSGTRELTEALEKAKNKPEVFISASAVGYYGNSEEAVDEYSPPGNDFLAGVVKSWEDETKRVDPMKIRRVNIRIGLVLDGKEGTLAKMIVPFRYFIGGPLGSGKQWFPWIHIDDLVGLFLFALDNGNMSGIINGVSPNPVRMDQFCNMLGKVLHRPSLFRIPAFLLRLVLGEAADVILSGAQVIPKRTLAAGYKFRFESVSGALNDLLV